MDLRTFRRNGPGLAECESQAAWRRLWGDRRAHRSRDTRGPVSNVAASWPQFGYRGQTHSTLCAARVLTRSRWRASQIWRGYGASRQVCNLMELVVPWALAITLSPGD